MGCHGIPPLQQGSLTTQTIMLLLGGFAIASAFTKHFIAKRMATWVLSKVSSKPQYVLLANMLVATFASMWITNVAAPVLCFSLLQPILRTLPSGHSFAKSLVLGRLSLTALTFEFLCCCQASQGGSNAGASKASHARVLTVIWPASSMLR